MNKRTFEHDELLSLIYMYLQRYLLSYRPYIQH